MAAATNDAEGSGLAVMDCAGVDLKIENRTCCESTGSVHLLFTGWAQDFAILAYWSVWAVFAAWVLRFSDQYDRSNGWWMVLVVFGCTSGSAAPSCVRQARLRIAADGLATVTAAFLIYGTFEWCADILDAWSLGPPGQWLRILAIPLCALAGCWVTAIILVPLLRRMFILHSRFRWVVIALPTGLANFGASLGSVSRWQTHWKANCIELFICTILPLVLIALDERIAARHWNGNRMTAATSRVWSGEIPGWLALFIVYPLTLVGANWARSSYFDLPRDSLTGMRHDNLEALTWLLLVLILVAGSTITWRCLNRNAARFPRLARYLQGVVLLVAAPVLIATGAGKGFVVGDAFNNSVKTALGSAYDFRVRAGGTELELSGKLTYGVAERLADELRIHPAIQRIRLSSQGGLVDEGFRAAQIIAAHKIDTVISEECASSCAIMFVAGVHRYMEKDAQLGFHAARDGDPLVSAKGSMSGALESFGIERSFTVRVETIAPPAVWYPTRKELLSAHILTAAPSDNPP